MPLGRNTLGKHPGKHGNVEPEILLRQEAIFGREFDRAEAANQGIAIGHAIGCRHSRGKLQVRRAAVIDVDAGFAAGVGTRSSPIGEIVYLEVLVIRRFRIVRQIERRGQRRTDAQH